jgi:protein O-mannosyl-transferase
MSRRPKQYRTPADRPRGGRPESAGGGRQPAERRPSAHTATHSNAPATTRYRMLIVAGLLLAAVVLIFGQTIHFEFINFDDDEYIYQNPQVTQGLSASGIAWAFTTHHAANWHPLAWLSHMLDCQVFGLQAGYHHLSSAVLHAVAAILLCWALWRMTADFWPSALVAALFAVHPLRAESVAWVAERKDVLAGLFFMLTLTAYVGYVRRPSSWPRYLSVVALFALGLMAKPVLVTLPFVLLLLDYWPLGRMAPSVAEDATASWGGSCTATPGATTPAPSQPMGSFPWRLVIEKIPLFALAAVSCVVTPIAQGYAVVPLHEFPLSARIGPAVMAYVSYVAKFLFPQGLAAFYPHPEASLPVGLIIPAVALLLGITAAALLFRRRCPYLLVGWFWYLGMLVPMIGLVQVGDQAMADRYTYLPQIGLCIALVWGVAAAAPSWPHRRQVLSGASVVVLTGLIACAWQQTTYWRNGETLWTHTLACTRRNAVAHNSLGAVLALEGRGEEAVPHYQEALSIKPDYPLAHSNYGLALFDRGQVADAIAHYQKALQVAPADPNTHYNFGLALQRTGRTAEAIAEYQKALQLRPDAAEFHNNLAAALQQQGHLEEAIAHYQQSLAQKPDNPAARFNFGTALEEQGRLPEAIAEWRAAVQLAPDQPRFLNQLALVLATSSASSLRNGPEAVALAQQAEQICEGQEPAVLSTLAAAYAEAGQFANAVEAAGRAEALAAARGDTKMRDLCRTRQKLYKSGLPYHEAPVQRGP